MTTIQIKVPIWLDFIFTWPLMQYRKRKFGWPFRKIDLGDGYFTIVEAARLLPNPSITNGGSTLMLNLYAARTEITPDLKAKIVFMHRQIYELPERPCR